MKLCCPVATEASFSMGLLGAVKDLASLAGEARSGNSALGLLKSAAGDRGAEAAVERKQLFDLLRRQQVMIPGNVRMRNGAGADQGSDAT